jgi:flagellar P-ring protein precursor FlgI
VLVPLAFAANLVPFISMIENIEVEPDGEAVVVINQRTGTIVLGHRVTIKPVVVTHGNMTLTFGAGIGALAGQEEEAESAGSANIEESGETTTEPAETPVAPATSTTAEEVAAGLTRMNLAPQDIVAIFEAIDAAGALLGKLEII